MPTPVTSEALPPETTLQVLEFLDAVSLASCQRTTSQWRRLAGLNSLWMFLCRRDFQFEGGKADYASRWQQERHRAWANLELYVQFADEVYLSVATLISMVSIFAVFPLLATLKSDGWLQVSWTQVFGSIYALGLLPMLYGLVRCAVLIAACIPSSTLHRAISYNGLVRAAHHVLGGGHQFASKVKMLSTSVIVTVLVAIPVHMYAVDQVWAPVVGILVWGALAVVVASTSAGKSWLASKPGVRHVTTVDAVSTTILFLIRATTGYGVPATIILSPIIHLTWFVAAGDGGRWLHPVVLWRVRLESLRHVLVGIKTLHPLEHYNRHGPVFSVLLFALRLDGLLAVPTPLIMFDYYAWLLWGPVAGLVRQRFIMMLREMPIPNRLRKL